MTDTQAERLIAAIQELEKSASRFAVAAERLLASGEEARARAEKTLKGFDAERLKEMSKKLDAVDRRTLMIGDRVFGRP